MHKKQNYFTFAISELPNIFQILALPTIMTILFENKNLFVLLFFTLGVLITLYIKTKESMYFDEPIPAYKTLAFAAVTVIPLVVITLSLMEAK